MECDLKHVDRSWGVHVFCKVQGSAELGSKSWKTDGQNESTNEIHKNREIFAPLRFAVLAIAVHLGISFEIFRCLASLGSNNVEAAMKLT